MNDELITTQQAAEILGITPDGVLHLVRTGKLHPATPIRPRQTTYFRRSDVERLAAERRKESARGKSNPLPSEPSEG